MNPEREPWERVPGEPARAYAAFRVYRDQPPATRSIEVTAASPDTSDAKPRQLRTLASRWNWRERAAAWDDELARVEDGERLEQIRQMHATHRKAGRAVVVKALQALNLVDPQDLPAGAAVRLLEIGTKLERQTLSQSVAELQGLEEDRGEDAWERIARELDPSTTGG